MCPCTRVQEIKVSVTIVCMCVYQKETEEVLYLHYPLVHHNLSHFILGGEGGGGGQSVLVLFQFLSLE